MVTAGMLLLAAALPATAQTPPPATPGAAAASAATAPQRRWAGYRLGVGDVITVTVYGQEMFNTTTRVKPDGSISLPLLGNVVIAGLTTREVEQKLSDDATRAGYLRNPIVTVEVNEYRSQTVRVVGNVANSGIQPLDLDYTLLDVLLRAGWVRGNGARVIYVRRPGQAEQEIDINKLLRADPEADIKVEPGMTIFVPEPELVYVMGPILRPGGYPLMEDMTIGRLITMAGGAAPGGNRKKFRLERDGKEVPNVTADTVLRPGDVVVMRGSSF
jgi:polysaccharide export outer membrane protein